MQWDQTDEINCRLVVMLDVELKLKWNKTFVRKNKYSVHLLINIVGTYLTCHIYVPKFF